MRRYWLMAVALLAAPAVANADPIASGGPNTFGTAQNVNSAFSLDPNINITNATTQPHAEVFRTTGASGFEFFRFTTSSAGTITLDIDSLAPSPAPTNFDTMIHLFDAAGNPLFTSDDNGNDVGDDPNSIIGGAFNSRIDTGVLPAGDYVAAVGAFFNTANPGGTLSGSQIPQGGSYTLNISANANIPEPVSLAVFGFAVATVGGIGWRRTRKA
jgi:hypothetical protein